MRKTVVPKYLLPILLGLALPAGCQVPEMFRRDADPYDESQYGMTSQQQADRLKVLAEEADSLAEAEQQRVSEQLYRELGQEESPILRLYMVRALRRLRAPAADAALAVATGDQDRDVKIEACRALGDRPGPESLRVLTEVVGSESDIDVRLAATRSLGKMNNPQAVPGLAIALDDPDPALQRRAVEGLKDVTGQELGNDVVAWQQYVKGETPALRGRENKVAEGSLTDRFLPWR
ncbi:MAG: HEAT repeat domain-containing protein [Pirellulales bacterium]